MPEQLRLSLLWGTNPGGELTQGKSTMRKIRFKITLIIQQVFFSVSYPSHLRLVLLPHSIISIKPRRRY